MLCYRRWKCIRRSSTTVTRSYETSLSCGTNAGSGMLQRNHPRLHWMHTHYTACNASLYPKLSILLQVLVTLPVTTDTPERSFSTLKRLKRRWAADIIGADPRTCMRRRRQSNLSKSLTSSLWLDHTSLISCARLSCFCMSCCLCLYIEVFACYESYDL